MSRWQSALGARLIRVSLLVDRGFKRFDQVRSFLITSLAGDGTLEAYNDLTYGATRVYDASAPQFRTRLFNWEVELVDRVFPKAPGRILVGGAGGGPSGIRSLRLPIQNWPRKPCGSSEKTNPRGNPPAVAGT